MTDSYLSLEAVEELHQAGDLAAAKNGYLKLLELTPQNSLLLHRLGLLFVEEGNWLEAEHYMAKANALEPSNTLLKIHLANIYKAQKNYPRAQSILQELIDCEPQLAVAHNNLGTIFFAQALWEQAIDSFRNAILCQADYVDAYYNLGLAYLKHKLIKNAESAFQSVIKLSPHHPGALFQLGMLCIQRTKLRDAIHFFSEVLANHPHHFESHSNIAAAYLKSGLPNEALSHYLKALELNNKDSQILFNLGVIHVALGRVNEGIAFYHRALNIHADFFAAHNNLGAAYLSIKNHEAALLHFNEALRLQPDNASIKHVIHILQQDGAATASPHAYVTSLFDAYANHYDAHLAQTLHYQAPRALFDALQNLYDFTQGNWDILDLGCGTGLSAEHFLKLKSPQLKVTGVDLSANMLALASRKNIYDELVQADIESFLSDKIACYRLIMAADVLVYLGDLENLFHLVTRALKAGGVFAFTAEISELSDYYMTPSGRFAHSRSYLNQLIMKNQFNIAHYSSIQLRTQENNPVMGHLFILNLPQTLT